MRPERASRGPAPGLRRDQIVAAAIALADADGEQAVSMRKVAAKLGSGTMTLYRHVRNRDELLELMLDSIVGEQPMGARSGDWRSDLVRLAGGVRERIHRHPWSAGHMLARPAVGPNTLALSEFGLGVLLSQGVDIDATMRMINTLTGFAYAYAMSELSEQEAQRRTGMTEEEWRLTNAPWVRQIMDSGDFPMVTRYVIEADDDPDRDEYFRIQLDYVLDGIARHVPDRA